MNLKIESEKGNNALQVAMVEKKLFLEKQNFTARGQNVRSKFLSRVAYLRQDVYRILFQMKLMHATTIWIESVQKTQIAEKHNMTKNSKALRLYWQCTVRVSLAALKGNNKDCFDMHTA